MPELINADSKIEILQNGAIKKIEIGQIMVNQVEGNELDGGLMNIYLRIKQSSSWLFKPLLGPQSSSKVKYGKNSAEWAGSYYSLSYQVQLFLQKSQWFWHVTVKNPQQIPIDLTYVQDLGMGTTGYVTSNEAYSSQYLDHFVGHQDDKIAIGSRQNQEQSGKFPYIQQGSFSALDSFATDGLQFFGTNFRAGSVPEALLMDHLESKKVQFESGIVSLRTKINQTNIEGTFYAAVTDQPKGNQALLFDVSKLEQQYREIHLEETQLMLLQLTHPAIPIGEEITGNHLSSTELNSYFPKQLQVEKEGNELLSFFTPDDEHVVLPAKEKRQQRPTGNIIMATNEITPGIPVLAATQFMSGIFESHVVYGNTNMQVLTTHTRDSLNIFKVTGTRIYIRESDQAAYRLLTLPSAYVMSYNGGDWIYKLADDVIEISDDAETTTAQLNLKFRSRCGKSYQVLVTTQLDQQTMGITPNIQVNGTRISIYPGNQTAMATHSPGLGYQIEYGKADAGSIKLADESVLFTDNNGESTHQIVARYQDVSHFEIQTATSTAILQDRSQAQIRSEHRRTIEQLIHGFSLHTENINKNDRIEQTNIVIRWFAHDALVHLLSPHGLEQYGGAAWGTRDVSQGPAELFLVTKHYKELRMIIEQLYSHQFVEDGNWPQWFMFDEYSEMFASESHGDIIVWPLKVVADYLNETKDVDILDVKLPYMSKTNQAPTVERVPLRDHIQKQIKYLKNHFLPNTYISSYGDGDWDDTLQPANPASKKNMASTWTMELTIETLRSAEQALKADVLQHAIAGLADNMYLDFKKYFMRDSVLPGFIDIDNNQQVHYIIHPDDRRTGIDYRLLPLSQGVLSGILNKEESANALKLIKKNLLFPDGVRLMNKPSTYHGGVSEIFKRAEQAANFGREIGLLYVHAHIRYADAIALSGDEREAWRLLQLVNPINLKQRVSNAALRQANVYFSSSDADFPDRYHAQQDYEKLRQQKIAVKGGWRLYSSGPGIYIATLLRDVLRFETFHQNQELNSLTYDTEITVKREH